MSWDELTEVLLDVELSLNNRPLGYVEDDVQMPILTPNVLTFGHPNHVPEEDVCDIEDTDLRKRARYIRECKSKLWSRWSNEYIRSLRERHNLTHDGKLNHINIGDVMLIKGEERNRAKWKIGIVTKLIRGRDEIVRGAILRAGKDHLERAVQHLYPMELQCDRYVDPLLSRELNPDAPIFRPRRTASVISTLRIRDQLEVENNVPIVEI